MKGKAIPFAVAFIIMTFLASITWIFLLARVLPVRGRLLPLLLSIPMILLGGYLATYWSRCFGFEGEEPLTVGILVSVVSFLAMLFFAL
ncbi:hypothetical protein E3E36_03855 [Thermococcus sp. M36]|uniref:hypothetical protein n=1 Tax=Thermococcus sp. M36 TaxID=1638261 RepID=UPI00143B2CBD|nr:hypothetical protein [Thermococcus sp. M36]NJE05288.1 hypothetical protein [Thermococcus sp. M36]